MSTVPSQNFRFLFRKKFVNLNSPVISKLELAYDKNYVMYAAPNEKLLKLPLNKPKLTLNRKNLTDFSTKMLVENRWRI